ncbi:MAG: glycosyltransferase WbuB, partial [Candidatus Micrarchaeia archaeon]
MYSGKPIIHAIISEKEIVNIANCGISVEAENPELIAEAIIKLKNMYAESRISMGLNGKEYVINNHSYGILAKKFLEVL